MIRNIFGHLLHDSQHGPGQEAKAQEDAFPAALAAAESVLAAALQEQDVEQMSKVLRGRRANFPDMPPHHAHPTTCAFTTQ